MPTKKMKFEDFLSVDIDMLRPKDSYTNMVNIRNERMKFFVDDKGDLKPEMATLVTCPLCDFNEYTALFQKEGFDFVQCNKCTAVYVNPCLNDEYIKQVYSHQSYTDLVKSLVSESTQYRRKRFGLERIGLVNNFIEEKAGRERKLLDLGCSTGFFLEAAQEQGWDAYGIEANPYLADFAQKNGLNVRCEMIEESSFEKNSFDAITLFDLIEHTKRPMEILKKVYDLTTSGGIILIYTPNFECAEKLILGTESHFIWGSNHTVYFTIDTLRYALEKIGYEIVFYETQGLDIDDICWYIEHNTDFDTRILQEYKDKFQFLINASDWGKTIRMIGKKVK